MEKIITERCCLTKIVPGDMEDVVKVYTNKETRKFLGGAVSYEEALRKFSNILEAREDIFAVRLKKSAEFIGIIYISPYYDTGFYEISYEFLPQFWGRGYAFEVMKQSLKYCCKHMEIREIVAETQKKNKRSRRLLEKLGYMHEEEIVRFGEEQIVYRIKLQ